MMKRWSTPNVELESNGCCNCSNIALIKYWGNRDQELRLPSNPSLSMNLAGLTTTTHVEFDPSLTSDVLILDGREVTGAGRERVSRFLDQVRVKTSEVFETSEVSRSSPALKAATIFPRARGWPHRRLDLPRWPWPPRPPLD